MRRLSIVAATCLLALWLGGCGESPEKQFSKKVEGHLDTLNTRVEQAYQAKNNLDSNLTSLRATASKLQEDANSLRNSIEELSTTLRNMQEELKTLKNEQSQFKKDIEGIGFGKWLLILLIFGGVVYLGYRFLKQKPFEEEEEEDFSAFEEDLPYDEKGDEEKRLSRKDEETQPSI